MEGYEVINDIYQFARRRALEELGKPVAPWWKLGGWRGWRQLGAGEAFEEMAEWILTRTAVHPPKPAEKEGK